MPRQVDHAHRREELAAALWRLVMRDGIEAASIRRVAAEAGCSSGSLRHYFDTQSQLLAFAMELVVERVTARVLGPWTTTITPAGWRRPCRSTSQRRAEAEVWLAFTARALVDPRAAARCATQAHAALRGLCVEAAALRAAGGQLHALVDGLALHGILAPDVTTPERQLELLREQLERAGRPSPR